MRTLLRRIVRRQHGNVLPVVVILMSLGSLLLVPSLSYVSTSVTSGDAMEKKLQGLYAAETGVEDALWKLKYDCPATFPHTYALTDVNGMSVSVSITVVDTIAGKSIGSSGSHDESLIIVTSTTYNAGTYYYTLSATNNGSGNIKIEMILIDLPSGLSYVPGSTGGDLYASDPEVAGNVDTGITLVWEILPPHPTIPETATRLHTFRLTGDPDISGPQGHACVRATRQDVGTVWDVETRPFSILAEARDSSNAVVAAIKAGLWETTQTSISYWQVLP